MLIKVFYTGDQIIIDFVILIVALQCLSAFILWLFLNTVGYLLSVYPVKVYWE